ncbi:hypothetical protein [Sphingobium fluviale]|uniref:Uncharacterized protein n=1 Tax=Sphingobium fluviale TaxID=2506423 RepID=A0A4V1N434_9SPHN|nr:hypothetical protein [Sphingobium fluviale]RXR30776.1 hypothetical protein EQG66_00290 [Sphingobium fluviale]
MAHENLALPYVLGALSPIERDAITRARLYDRSLEHAIASFERHMVAHLQLGDRAVPPTDLWRNIVSALAEERAALAGRRIETFPDGQWQAIAPGTEAKQMAEDAWLLRCDPGVAVSSRPLGMDEHLLIVAGDLCLSGRCFSTGDYLFSPAEDSAADELHSISGCILLVLRAASQNIPSSMHPPDGPAS